MPEAPGRERTLTEMLGTLHEHFSVTGCKAEESDEYRRGHLAGMGFARLCVLDQLAGAAIMPRVEQDSVRRHRGELVALEAIGHRLGTECHISAPAGADEYSRGYRAGVSMARTYIGLTHDALELRTGPL